MGVCHVASRAETQPVWLRNLREDIDFMFLQVYKQHRQDLNSETN